MHPKTFTGAKYAGYAPADGQTNQKIDDIRTLYKQRFAQESALLVTSPAKVKF